MTKTDNRKNRFRRVVRWSGVVVLLCLIVILTAPWLINQEIIKKEALAITSQKFGRLTYESVELPLFPKPHLILHAVRVSREDATQFAAKELRVIPQFFPLFRGTVALEKIQMISPQTVISMPRPAAETTADARQPVRKIPNRMQEVLAGIFSARDDGLEIEIHNGTLTLNQAAGGRIFEGRFSASVLFQNGIVSFEVLSRKASSWNRFTADGNLNLESLDGDAKIQIEQLAPLEITESMQSDWLPENMHGRADLDLDLRYLSGDLSASLHAGNLSLSVGHDQLIRDVTMAASLKTSGTRWVVNVEKIVPSNSSSFLEGTLVSDTSKPHAKLRVRAQNLKIEKWFHALLLLLPAYKEDIGDVQDVLRGGIVPNLQLTVSAPDIAGMLAEEAVTANATISNCTLHIETPDLEITDVSGDVRIQNGLLTAHNLQGIIGKSTARRGELTLGFNETLAPFYLKTDITADLAVLPKVLQQISDSEAFNAELDKIDHVRGNAAGTLVLKGNTDQLEETISVREVHLAGRYDRIPYPIEISQSDVYWEANQLRIRNLQGQIGKSMIQNLHADVDGSGADVMLSIFSSMARVDISEADAWMQDVPSIREFLHGADFSDGVADLQVWHLSGPAAQPGKWQTQLQCRIQGVRARPSFMKQALTIQQAAFRTRETLGPVRGWDDWVLEQSEIKCADSVVSLNGNVQFEKQTVKLDLTAAADKISWETWAENIKAGDGSKKEPQPLSVVGVVKLNAGVFQKTDLRWESVYADVLLDREETRIIIPEAGLCGIQTPSQIQIGPKTWRFEMNVSGKNRNLASVIDCLWHREKWMTGQCDLTGQLTIESAANQAGTISEGTFSLQASNGRIYRSTILAKVLAVVNVSEIFKGKLPDLFQEGFAYETARAGGRLEGKNLRIDELVIDGASMEIFASGTMAIESGDLNLELLVAPLKTVDSIVRHVPILTQILGGNLVTIPVKVTGTRKKPKVVPMEINAVGSGLLRVVDRTLRLPATMVAPLMEKDPPPEQ